MILTLTILISLLGIVIAVYDIKSKSIPIIFLGLHFLSIIIYISLYSIITGIILGLSGVILFLLCLRKKFTIDWVYVLLICVGLILLKYAKLFIPIMLLPVLLCACIVMFAKSKQFPYMTCLTSVITFTLIFLLF